MKALWLEEGNLSIRDGVELPAIRKGEALIRIILAGICNTDLELIRGYYPFTGIPGHEFVGIIEEAPGCPEREGERVTGNINAVCHSCDMCQRGWPEHCRNRTVLGIAGRDGVFAEYTSLPLENLLTVPGNVSSARAVFAEPLAAALQVTEQVRISKKDRVMVVGSGKLGQLISESLLVQGIRADAVPRYPSQKSRLEELGISCLKEEDCAGASHDVVIEATGSRAGLEFALGLVRPRGTLVLKSTYKGRASCDFSRVVVDEITLIGSRCGPMEKALDLMSNNRIKPETAAKKIFPLEQAVEAFKHAARKGSGKILVRIPDSESLD